MAYIKQLLDEVFVISRIIKVEVRTANFSRTMKSEASSQKNGRVLLLEISIAAANVISVNQ